MRASATRQRIVPLAVLLIGGAVLGLSLPRLNASLAYLPVDTALKRHWAGAPLAGAQLDALAQRATTALERYPHYRYRDGLSVLEYLRGQDPNRSTAERIAALERAADAALASVAEAPMKPAAWLRVALARYSLGYPPELVLRPLVLSVYTGRVEPTLLLLRLRLFYDLQRQLSPDERRLLTDQTLLAWQLDPRGLVRRIRSGDIAYDRIAAMLAPAHPTVLDEIDEVIRGSVR